jgi:hypothetical protein
MDHEIDSLEKAGTWTIVPRPADKNVVGCKWVFRLKRKADSSVEKYKAWLHTGTQGGLFQYLLPHSKAVKLLHATCDGRAP